GLRMHEVFQEVIMDGMSEEDRDGAVGSAIDALARLFPSGDDPRQWPRCAELLTHGETLIANARPEELMTSDAARLMRSMGSYLRFANGARYRALEFHQQALTVQQDLRPGNDLEVADTLELLAGSLYWTGDYDESQRVAERSVRMLRNLHSGDHPALAR